MARIGKNTLSFYIFSLGIFCLLVVFTSCQKDEIPLPKNRGYIYFGLVVPRSGPLVKNGEAIVRGAELAVEAINKTGGIKTRPVKLLIRDEMEYKTDPSFGGLAKDPRVTITIGHLLERAFEPARVLYLQAEHPVLLPFLSGDDVSHSGSGLFFRLLSSDSDQAQVLAEYARDSLKAGSYLVVHSQSEYSLKLARKFAEMAGVEQSAIVKLVEAPEKTADVRGFMGIMKKMKPDIVFLAVNGRLAVSIAKFIAESKIKTTVMGTQVLGSADVVSFLSRLSPSAYLSLPENKNKIDHDSEKFYENYLARYHLAPNWLAVLARDAVYLAREAVNRAGDRPEMVRNYLTGLDKAEKAFQGLSGSLYFAPEGRGIKPAAIVKVTPSLINNLP